MHVIELFLPVVAASDMKLVLRQLREEMTNRFGGATIFSRTPAEGEWINEQQQHERDEVIIVEVMTDTLDRDYWRAWRKRLEGALKQEEILIRARETVVI